MMLQPAHKISLIFIALFLIVVGVALAGSFYYKNTTPLNSEGSFAPNDTTTPTPAPEPKTNLQLIPTADQTTYKIVISDITKPISGVVFQLQSSAGGAQITSNSIETDPALEAAGWSTAINSSTETDASQALSFSMILNSPGAEVNVQSLEIGTITFDQTPASNEVLLNFEESYVSYTDDTVSYLNLTMGN